jgi:hypothetical protein
LQHLNLRLEMCKQRKQSAEKNLSGLLRPAWIGTVCGIWLCDGAGRAGDGCQD